jgi:hypothetical protein
LHGLSIKQWLKTLVILLVTSSLIRYHLTDEKESVSASSLPPVLYTLPSIKV